MSDSFSLGPVGVVDIARYAGASGDFNPLHLDDAYARGTGSPGVFAMGMLAAGWAASALAAHAGSWLAEFEVRFRDRVWPGDRLVLTPEEDSAGWSYTVADQDGRVVMTGRACGGGAGAPNHDGAVPTPSGEPLGAPYRWVVEEGAVRDFAAAVHASPRQVPTTFLVTAQRWRPSDDFIDSLGIDVRRMLHGGSTFELPAGPIPVGVELRVTDSVTGRERLVGKRGGEMLAVDVSSVATDAYGAVRARTTMRLLELAEVAAPSTESTVPVDRGAGEQSYVRLDPPALLGSRDPGTGQTYFPPRALSADGALRACDPVDLATEGELFTWTEIEGVPYGQVDLPEGTRIQTRLGAGPHEIGASYVLAVAPAATGSLDWWFDRAGA